MFWISKLALFIVFFLLVTSPCNSQPVDTDVTSRLESAKTLLEAGKIDESIEVLSRILESGASPLANYYRGMALTQKGMQAAAIRDYSEAIKKEPTQSVYYARRGISRLSQGDIPDAITDLNRSLELEPSSPSVLSFRARALMMSSRHSQALEDINKAIQLSPNNSGFFKLRGDILTSAENYENAVLDYDRAIQLTPGFAAALNNRGIALAHLNRVK